MGIVNDKLSKYGLDIRQMTLFTGCLNKSFNNKLASEIKQMYSNKQINIFSYKTIHQFVISKVEKRDLRPIENEHFYGFEYNDWKNHTIITNEKMGWTKNISTYFTSKFLLSLDDNKLRYYKNDVLEWTSSSSPIPTEDELKFIESITYLTPTLINI